MLTFRLSALTAAALGTALLLSACGQRRDSAAKAGVLGLARAMAREYGGNNIRVNCVTPGLIATDINKGKIPEDKRQTILDGIPLGRIGERSDATRLEGLLSDSVWWVRYRTAQALLACVSAPQANALLSTPEPLAPLLETTWNWLQEPGPDGAPHRAIAPLGHPLYPLPLLDIDEMDMLDVIEVR